MDEDEFNELMNMQRRMASTIVQESNQDAKIKLITLISDMSQGSNKRVSVEAVIIEANLLNVDDSTALRLLEELKDDDLITIPEPGFIQLA